MCAFCGRCAFMCYVEVIEAIDEGVASTLPHRPGESYRPGKCLFRISAPPFPNDPFPTSSPPRHSFPMAPTAHPHCEVIHFTLPATLRSLLLEIPDLKEDGRFGEPSLR